MEGEIDIAWVAEFPFVKRAFAKEEIRIITVVGRFSEQHLFGRPRNTIAEFYMGRFLELHGMTAQDVTIIDVPAQESVDAIESGRVDGVIVWEPYSSKIGVQLADRVVALPVRNNQPGYGIVASRNNWIAVHPEVANSILKSLAQAEDYLTRNPAQAKAIVRKQLNYDDAFTEIIWSENQFSLSLDQSLILAMEDEARWMIKNNLTTEKQVPDFLDYIYMDGLEKIKPESVNIIR